MCQRQRGLQGSTNDSLKGQEAGGGGCLGGGEGDEQHTCGRTGRHQSSSQHGVAPPLSASATPTLAAAPPCFQAAFAMPV